MRLTGDHVAVGAMGVTGLGGFVLPTGLADAGPWALLVSVVAFIFYGVFRGWIVPKPHYDTLLERALAAEAALNKVTETNGVQADTILKSTAVGDTVIRVMGAIQDAREKTASEPIGGPQ
jgi:hypothetical protein